MTRLFTQFMQTEARRASALYILGDFFDFWFGDDDLNDFSRLIIQTLRHFTDNGTPCYFMHGNHDFMVNHRFANMTGIQLLSDPHVITHHDKRYLISHGDYLCIDDIEYQRFRSTFTNPRNQKRFLLLPKWIRRVLRRYAGKQSKAHQSKAKYINDINHRFAIKECHKYRADTLIHGHTHQPIIDHLQKTSPIKRITLPAWEEQGGYLEINSNNETLLKSLELKQKMNATST